MPGDRADINCKWYIYQPNIRQKKGGLAKVMKDRTDFKYKTLPETDQVMI